MEEERISSYVKPSADTLWPNPCDPNDIEWVLRYGNPTESEKCVAASYINAYKALFSKTQKNAVKTMSAIKKAYKDQKSDRNFKIGDTVAVYSLMYPRKNFRCQSKIVQIAPMHSKGKPMLWLDNIAGAYDPDACEIVIPNATC